MEELTQETIKLAQRCIRRLAENPEEILDILGIKTMICKSCAAAAETYNMTLHCNRHDTNCTCQCKEATKNEPETIGEVSESTS